MISSVLSAPDFLSAPVSASAVPMLRVWIFDDRKRRRLEDEEANACQKAQAYLAVAVCAR